MCHSVARNRSSWEGSTGVRAYAAHEDAPDSHRGGRLRSRRHRRNRLRRFVRRGARTRPPEGLREVQLRLPDRYRRGNMCPARARPAPDLDQDPVPAAAPDGVAADGGDDRVQRRGRLAGPAGRRDARCHPDPVRGLRGGGPARDRPDRGHHGRQAHGGRTPHPLAAVPAPHVPALAPDEAVGAALLRAGHQAGAGASRLPGPAAFALRPRLAPQGAGRVPDAAAAGALRRAPGGDGSFGSGRGGHRAGAAASGAPPADGA